MNPFRPENLPDREACLAIMTRYGMPAHVIRHSQAVCAVALYLTRRLGEQGLCLDHRLVQASALLHDITKAYSFNRPLDHALTGAKLLKHMGYPQVAVVVRQHVRISPSRPRGRISETEVVNYSDKRVVDDRITSLEERLDYIRNRYARTPEMAVRIKKYSQFTLQLEMEIFAIVPGGPGQLNLINVERECELS
jgi:putative nucleotidyltransferase with HDIG domain